MKKVTTLIICIAMVGFLKLDAIAQDYSPLEMGVNVNERPHWLKPELLKQSKTTWVRAFIEASHYIKGNRNLNDDFRVEAIKESAKNGYKVLLSIKWDIKEADWRVPEPGSPQEEQWFKFAGELLQELEGDLSMLVLVNEITIDTPNEDLQPDEEGQIPFVQFQQRLLDYVSELSPQSAGGESLPIYTGGFTRLDQKKQQEHPANLAVMEWANNDDRLAGVDFHMHQPDYETTIESANFIREQVPEKSLIVTEFSLVWKWRAHLGDRIGSTEKGRAFAEQYGVDPDLTVAEYSTKAFNRPATDTEWQDFLKSQPWFEPDYLDIMGRIMELRDVDVATYAFTQNPNQSKSWKATEKMSPWYIHQLFYPHLKRSKAEVAPHNYGMFENFVRWQTSTNAIKTSK